MELSHVEVSVSDDPPPPYDAPPAYSPPPQAAYPEEVIKFNIALDAKAISDTGYMIFALSC